jgi:hypothetical protein
MIAIALFMILGFLITRLIAIPALFTDHQFHHDHRVGHAGALSKPHRRQPEVRAQDFLARPPVRLLVYGANAETDVFLHSLQSRPRIRTKSLASLTTIRKLRSLHSGIKVLGAPQI